MSHTRKNKNNYDRIRYLKDIKKPESKDTYKVALELANVPLNHPDALIIDVTDNKLYYAKSERIRRRMLMNLAQQYGATSALLTRRNEQGVLFTVQWWRKS